MYSPICIKLEFGSKAARAEKTKAIVLFLGP